MTQMQQLTITETRQEANDTLYVELQVPEQLQPDFIFGVFTVTMLVTA